MPDLFSLELGGTTAPVVAQAQGTAVPDIALETIGQYLKALFIAYANATWRAAASGRDVVKNVYLHDPEQHAFNEEWLPALYLFRMGSSKPPEQAAEDFSFTYDKVRIFWVMPPAPQEARARQETILPLLVKIAQYGIAERRDPSYVAAGDPDPTAADQGTVFVRRGGLLDCNIESWVTTNLLIGMLGPTPVTYRSLDMQLQIKEAVESTMPGAFQGSFQVPGSLANASRLDLKVTNPEGDVVTEGLFLGSFSDAFSDAFDN
jgi:hypothetical protein